MARKRGGASYPCPECETPTEVVLTKSLRTVTARWRKCPKCSHEFLTQELEPPKEYNARKKR